MGNYEKCPCCGKVIESKDRCGNEKLSGIFKLNKIGLETARFYIELWSGLPQYTNKKVAGKITLKP